MVQPECCCCGLPTSAAPRLPQEKQPCRALCSSASSTCFAPMSPSTLWAQTPRAPAAPSAALAQAAMPVFESGLAVTSADGAAFTEGAAAGGGLLRRAEAAGASAVLPAVPPGAPCSQGTQLRHLAGQEDRAAPAHQIVHSAQTGTQPGQQQPAVLRR